MDGLDVMIYPMMSIPPLGYMSTSTRRKIHFHLSGHIPNNLPARVRTRYNSGRSGDPIARQEEAPLADASEHLLVVQDRFLPESCGAPDVSFGVRFFKPSFVRSSGALISQPKSSPKSQKGQNIVSKMASPCAFTAMLAHLAAESGE